MLTLLLVLIPIALIDSTAPVAFAALLATLAGAQPQRRGALFIAGQFLTYFLVGLGIMFGLDAIFDAVDDLLESLLYVPTAPELVLQIAIGAALCVVGTRRAMRRGKPATSARPKAASQPTSLWRAFALGVVTMAAIIPVNLVYFAAIDQILGAELSRTSSAFALFIYNLLFSLPLLAIYAFVTARGERALAVLAAFMHRIERALPIIVGALLALLGLAMIADGVGWFFGRPLIPV